MDHLFINIVYSVDRWSVILIEIFITSLAQYLLQEHFKISET